MSNRTHFMSGFNTGSRHVKLGGSPPGFDLTQWRADYQAGYKVGAADRTAGKLTDNLAATNCINAAWDVYSKGGTQS